MRNSIFISSCIIQTIMILLLSYILYNLSYNMIIYKLSFYFWSMFCYIFYIFIGIIFAFIQRDENKNRFFLVIASGIFICTSFFVIGGFKGIGMI